MGLEVAFGKYSESENRLTIKIPLQPKPQARPPHAVMCLDCVACPCLCHDSHRLTPGIPVTHGPARPHTPTCTLMHRDAWPGSLLPLPPTHTHTQITPQFPCILTGTARTPHILKPLPHSTQPWSQSPILPLAGPPGWALPSSLILTSCFLKAWGTGTHFNGSVVWGFFLHLSLSPWQGVPWALGPKENRMIKAFWGQRKDSAGFGGCLGP